MKWYCGAALMLTTIFLAGCVGGGMSHQTSTNGAAQLPLGENICAGEARQIYFTANSAQMSPIAAEVVSRVATRLVACPNRKIVLLSVSGDDGPPASMEVQQSRLAAVTDGLVTQGSRANRITSLTQGTLVDRAPRGPVGGVVILTTR